MKETPPTTDQAPRGTFDPVAHKYRIDGIEAFSVTEVLADNDLIDTRWFDEKSRSRGAAVHVACEYLDTPGGLDMATLHPELHGYVKSWETFKLRFGVEILSVEQRVWDYGRGLGGTYDNMARFSGRIWLLDRKTVGSAKGTAPFWARYQTAAYAVNLPGIEPHDIYRCAIVLMPDGSLPKVKEYDEASDYPDFLDMLNTSQIKRRHHRGIKYAGRIDD